jgi:prevent-host-death family protein
MDDVINDREDAAMRITSLSSRELNQDFSRAKRQAADGPVFITQRGRPAYVLLTIEEYQRITRERRDVADAVAMADKTDIVFDPGQVTIDIRPADFS